MEKSAKAYPTSSATTVEAIAKKDTSEAEEIIKTIEETPTVEKTPSIDDQISQAQKTIGDVQNALMNGPHDCACHCCVHNKHTNHYLHQFLRDLMVHESMKFQQLRLYFSRQDEKN